MRRKATLGLAAWCAVIGVLMVGCDDLSEEECLKLRGDAFDIINDAHTCNDDADCAASEWPGCAKPINTKNQERIAPLKEKFTKGSCKDDEQTCPEAPLMYCKQGLCVAMHEAGESGNPTQ